jgi:nickel/cobalt transporter (NiCoT) family protein
MSMYPILCNSNTRHEEGNGGMEVFSLILFVFVLGLRHGLDADHLACIDGLVRYNWRKKSKVTRWVGTLFSFGHGTVVASVAVVLSAFSRNFKFPDYFDTLVTWVSVLSLLLIGTLNIRNLLIRTEEEYKLGGIRGRFIPRFARETSNPIHIVIIGAIFALAADTVSQTSVWAIAASHASRWMPAMLGLTFMAGMMLTDTIDSFITCRMLEQSGKLGKAASRIMGWIIVVLAYGVACYEAIIFFVPSFEVDFEIIGAMMFALIVLCYVIVRFGTKAKPGIGG